MIISYMVAIHLKIIKALSPMLNQTAIYAVRAMGFLATQKAEEPILSRTIAREMDIPKNFLSKILNRLVQAGLIHSVRGRNGGFVLSTSPSKIRIRDVVDLFMKLEDYQQCFLGLKKCDGSCGLHIRWKIIAEQFEKMLNDTTVDRIF